MPTIHLQTEIFAPQALVFDLSRNIDFHQASLAHTQEVAVAGCTTGLIGLGQWVTWEGRHFGIRQRLTVEITALNPPTDFVDEMVNGAFKAFRHLHRFEATARGTLMHDEFSFTSPFGIIGRCFNALVLTRYMTHVLRTRNAALKEAAELAAKDSHG
jgi:ligand-binding SRPBCC domain-containing protein